ncbi:MAG: hypothetical protein M3R67_02600 [Acidobacteriota bacterium]|nr:hypothetical protein [Acidobacteriota bacterium]
MRKIAPLFSALFLSLLLSTAAFGGEILTPGITISSPPPAGTVPGDQKPPGSPEAPISMEFIYDLFLMVF